MFPTLFASNNLFPDRPILAQPAAAPSVPIYNRQPATNEEQRGATARQPRPNKMMASILRWIGKAICRRVQCSEAKSIAVGKSCQQNVTPTAAMQPAATHLRDLAICSFDVFSPRQSRKSSAKTCPSPHLDSKPKHDSLSRFRSRFHTSCYPSHQTLMTAAQRVAKQSVLGSKQLVAPATRSK